MSSDTPNQRSYESSASDPSSRYKSMEMLRAQEHVCSEDMQMSPQSPPDSLALEGIPMQGQDMSCEDVDMHHPKDRGPTMRFSDRSQDSPRRQIGFDMEDEEDLEVFQTPPQTPSMSSSRSESQSVKKPVERGILCPKSDFTAPKGAIKTKVRLQQLQTKQRKVSFSSDSVQEDASQELADSLSVSPRSDGYCEEGSLTDASMSDNELPNQMKPSQEHERHRMSTSPPTGLFQRRRMKKSVLRLQSLEEVAMGTVFRESLDNSAIPEDAFVSDNFEGVSRM